MILALLGFNYRTAQLSLREKLSLPREKLIDRWKELSFKFDEILLLSTCNRIEFYYKSSQPYKYREDLLKFIKNYSSVEIEELRKRSYFFLSKEVLYHLFALACGLDSQAQGESQIVTQLKEALLLAEQLQSISSLRELFKRAIMCGRKIQSQRRESLAVPSLSLIAVEEAEKRFGKLDGKIVALVGCGKVNQLVAKLLVKKKSVKIYIISRTFDRAKEIAKTLGVEPGEFSTLPVLLKEVDLLISATSSPHYVIREELLLNVIKSRRHPLLIIDLALPRDVEWHQKELSNIEVLNIDELMGSKENILECKRTWEEIFKEAQALQQWEEERKFAPVIREIIYNSESILKEELTSLGEKEKSLSTSPLVQEFGRRIKARLLHYIFSLLKSFNLLSL